MNSTTCSIKISGIPVTTLIDDLQKEFEDNGCLNITEVTHIDSLDFSYSVKMTFKFPTDVKYAINRMTSYTIEEFPSHPTTPNAEEFDRYENISNNFSPQQSAHESDSNETEFAFNDTISTSNTLNTSNNLNSSNMYNSNNNSNIYGRDNDNSTYSITTVSDIRREFDIIDDNKFLDEIDEKQITIPCVTNKHESNQSTPSYNKVSNNNNKNNENESVSKSGDNGNNKKDQINDKSNPFFCENAECMGFHPNNELIYCSPGLCDHKMSPKCLETYILSHIAKNEVPLCPGYTGCTSDLSEKIIGEHLSQNVLRLYLKQKYTPNKAVTTPNTSKNVNQSASANNSLTTYPNKTCSNKLNHSNNNPNVSNTQTRGCDTVKNEKDKDKDNNNDQVPMECAGCGKEHSIRLNNEGKWIDCFSGLPIFLWPGCNHQYRRHCLKNIMESNVNYIHSLYGKSAPVTDDYARVPEFESVFKCKYRCCNKKISEDDVDKLMNEMFNVPSKPEFYEFDRLVKNADEKQQAEEDDNNSDDDVIEDMNNRTIKRYNEYKTWLFFKKESGYSSNYNYGNSLNSNYNNINNNNNLYYNNNSYYNNNNNNNNNYMGYVSNKRYGDDIDRFDDVRKNVVYNYNDMNKNKNNIEFDQYGGYGRNVINKDKDKVSNYNIENDIGNFECQVCFDTYSKEMIFVGNEQMCENKLKCWICRNCARYHCKSSMSGSSTTGPQWPLCCNMECRMPFDEHQIRNLFTDNEYILLYQKWSKTNIENKIVSGYDDIEYCPNPECTNVAALNPKKPNIFDCNECNKIYCLQCGRMELNGKFGIKTHNCNLYKQGKNINKLDEQMKQYSKYNGVKKCPGCGQGVQKNQGCNHMTCRCGTNWCWLCCGEMDPNNLSSHKCINRVNISNNRSQQPVPQPHRHVQGQSRHVKTPRIRISGISRNVNRAQQSVQNQFGNMQRKVKTNIRNTKNKSNNNNNPLLTCQEVKTLLAASKMIADVINNGNGK